MSYLGLLQATHKEIQARLGMARPPFEPVRGFKRPVPPVDPDMLAYVRGRRIKAANRVRMLVDSILATRTVNRLAEVTTPISMARIVREVAAAHQVAVMDIMSPRRARPLIIARHEAMYRCRHETAHSYPVIARFFKRDHTTVIFGCEQHAARLAKRAAHG